MDFQNNLGREEEDSQTRDIRRRRNKGGKSVSEEILTSSLAWKDKGGEKCFQICNIISL